jgi:hypothetical protein
MGLLNISLSWQIQAQEETAIISWRECSNLGVRPEKYSKKGRGGSFLLYHVALRITLNNVQVFFPLTGACRPIPEANAPINWRALFEHSELARPPVTCVRLI